MSRSKKRTSKGKRKNNNSDSDFDVYAIGCFILYFPMSILIHQFSRYNPWIEITMPGLVSVLLSAGLIYLIKKTGLFT